MDRFTWIKIQTRILVIIGKIDQHIDKIAHHGIAELITAIILITGYGLFLIPLEKSAPIWTAFWITLIGGIFKDLVIDKLVRNRSCSIWDIIATWSGSWPWVAFYYIIR